MKLLSILVMILTLGLTTLTMSDAEAAKRLGGGKSTGMQRENTTQPANSATPAAAGAAGAAAAAAPKRSWMGPLAGLAAGLGLAALASYLGFGEELATALMIGLVVMLVMAVVGFFIMRKRMAQAGANGVGGMPMQYAGAGAGAGMGSPSSNGMPPMNAPFGAGTSGAAAGGSMIGANLNPNQTARVPADFDAVGFANNAKSQFIRLQAAFDRADAQDIRQFTTPEMFAEVRADLDSRGPATSTNEVVYVDAQVVDVTEEAQRYIVSVRFSGVLRDSRSREEERVDEVWHLVKARDGQSGWLLSGIQQVG